MKSQRNRDREPEDVQQTQEHSNCKQSYDFDLETLSIAQLKWIEIKSRPNKSQLHTKKGSYKQD